MLRLARDPVNWPLHRRGDISTVQRLDPRNCLMPRDRDKYIGQIVDALALLAHLLCGNLQGQGDIVAGSPPREQARDLESYTQFVTRAESLRRLVAHQHLFIVPLLQSSDGPKQRRVSDISDLPVSSESSEMTSGPSGV